MAKILKFRKKIKTFDDVLIEGLSIASRVFNCQLKTMLRIPKEIKNNYLHLLALHYIKESGDSAGVEMAVLFSMIDPEHRPDAQTVLFDEEFNSDVNPAFWENRIDQALKLMFEAIKLLGHPADKRSLNKLRMPPIDVFTAVGIKELASQDMLTPALKTILALMIKIRKEDFRQLIPTRANVIAQSSFWRERSHYIGTKGAAKKNESASRAFMIHGIDDLLPKSLTRGRDKAIAELVTFAGYKTNYRAVNAIRKDRHFKKRSAPPLK